MVATVIIVKIKYFYNLGKVFLFTCQIINLGEKIGNQECFHPEKNVTRGEFLAMVIKTLDIPLEEVSYDAIPEETPTWLKPYLAAAMRSGLTAGWPESESGSFEMDAPITGAEAAVMLQNVLDLTISQDTLETEQVSAQLDAEDVPAWAAVSLTAMAENGINMVASRELTRSDVAQILYQVCNLSINAPGMAVIRMQQ